MATISDYQSAPLAARPALNLVQFGWTVTVSFLLAAALFGIGVVALSTGEYELTHEQVLNVLFLDADDVTRAERIPHVIVHELRLPRLVLGMMVGGALAIAGVMLQDSMHNVLAEPGLLGVSSGAVVVVASITVFNIGVPAGQLPLLAMAGGIAAGMMLLFATTLKVEPVRLVLVGAAITAFLNALLLVVINLGEPFDIQVLYRFMVGSLCNRGWDDVHLILPWLVIGVPLALLSTRALNLLQLGDDLAEGLGLPVVRARLAIFGISIALVAAVVSVAGPVSFVALLAPHVARRILRTHDARRVMPVAGLFGAFLVIAADLMARTVMAPIELPVGLFTVLLGAPVLLVLLRREITHIK
ncbi:MAG: iron ABC transporter permease [Chloroflexi bacterium]|nr:iron ABC transporter permease [Chloroflexota bacterium]